MRASPRQVRAMFDAAREIRASDRLFAIETATFPHMEEGARHDVTERLRREARGESGDDAALITDTRELRGHMQKLGIG